MPIRPIEHGIFASSGAAAGGGFAYYGGTGKNTDYAIQDFIDKFAYADNTRTTLSATMSQGDGFPVSACVGVGNPGVAAYFMAGESPTGYGVRDGVVKIDFTDDTASLLSVTLYSPTYGGGGLSNAAVKGYYCGGNTYPAVSRINTFTFSTEAFAVSGSSLSYAPILPGSVNNNAVAGYICGGGGPLTTIDKVRFSDDVVSTLSAVLSPGGQGASNGASNAGVAGYLLGLAASTAIQKLTFATEARSTISATISAGRSYMANTSATGTAGYAMGGDGTGIVGNATAVVDRMEFSNETTSVLGTGLSTGTYYATAASNELGLV